MTNDQLLMTPKKRWEAWKDNPTNKPKASRVNPNKISYKGQSSEQKNMNYFTLKRWIEEGEGVQLDFKTRITSPSKIARNLVSFANCRGGKLVVGVEDKGHFIGVDIEQEKFELEKAATKFCNPAVEWNEQKIEHQGKQALIIEVPESNLKPHYALNKKQTAERMYVRIGDSCVVPPLVVQKMLENGELTFAYRTPAYRKTKAELLDYFKTNPNINVPTFAELQKLSENNAQRMLIDFLFEGIIKLKSSKPVMVFEPVA